MALGQSDGSIILSTKVDTKGIKSGTNSIMSMAKKAGSALAIAFSVKKIYDFVKASVDAFAEYEQLVGGVETLFKKSADKVMKYANEAYKTAGMSANEYMANVTSFSASLLSSLGGDTDKAAEVANDALIAMSDNANKMGSSMESITMAFQGFAKQQYMLLDNLKLGYGGTKTEMERLLKDAQAITGVEYNIDNLADVYTAIGVIQEKLGIAGTTAKEAATTISGSAGMMKASWKNVLVAISGGGDMDAAIENLANSVDIYFDNILPVVEKAIGGIGLLIEKIAPKLAETVGKAFIAEIPRLITSIYAMIVGAFRGLYRGIVELFRKETNVMLEEQAEKTEETAESQEKVTDNIKDTNKELKKTLAGFDEIQILSSKSADDEEINLPTVGGGESYEDFSSGEKIVQEVEETLDAIMGIAGVCLSAIGLILLFTGHIGAGIGFIVSGASSLGVSLAQAKQFDQSGVVQMITTIMGIAGGALLALGIILLWIGGVVGLPVSIGMIIAGGAMIVSAVAAQAALNPDDIAAWLSVIMGIVGGALLALGVILCMVGSIPLGIGLIIAGAGSLVTAFSLNSNAVVDWIKGVWDSVKNFWNRYIAPVFTAKFWLDLAKICGNGLIGGFEGAINGIISLFEKMINWIVDGLNSISFDVPDWVPFIGGKRFGFDIPRASFGRVKIPRLAQGAVIPPNREFLAVLGDQKQGTNIETPLATMVEAFKIALDSRERRGSGSSEVVLVVDGREFGRAAVELGDRERRLEGTRLVIS